MRKFLISLAAMSALLAVMAAPALAGGKDKTILDTVVKLSGPSGFDDNADDFDILREAAVATGLADKLGGTRQLTVFAPTDQAFLGLTGASNEQAAFDGVAALGLPAVKKVLKYHIAPERRTAAKVVKAKRIPTLLKGEALTKRARVRQAEGRDRPEGQDRRSGRGEGLEWHRPRDRRSGPPV